MLISVTELRANIYNIVDDVLRTGEPVEIERAGRRLRIAPVGSQAPDGGKLNRLIARPEAIVGAPEDFTHIDWSHEWNP